MNDKWYTQPIHEVFEALKTNEHGLEREDAKERIIKYGPNKLPEAKPDNLAIIFLRQFQSPLIYVLFAASIAVFALGEIVDGFVILAVLIFNSVIGTVQEGRAQNTLLVLKKFIETKAVVLREGKEMIISGALVVPGDIIMLQEGEKIPADARIITANNLKVDESTLTGESGSVHKVPGSLEGPDLLIAEQKNMIFKGTNIVAGNGKAVVVATGLDTAIGKIAKQIATIDTEVPLKTNVRNLSRLIIITVTSVGTILFGIGLLSGKPAVQMFATVVSLSVSVIPEGLPIVMTLILATGVWRMSKRNALVKKLQAVEALGQARVIAVDKTGTITKNEMTIQKVYVDNNLFEVSGVGYEPKGKFMLHDSIIDPLNHPELLFAGKIAAFCANARVMFSKEEQQWRVAGDPTEAAMLVFAQKLGFNKDDLERESPPIAEIPFDYRLKYHTTLHGLNGQNLLTVVGAPEVVLGLSEKIWREGKSYHLSEEEKQELEHVFISLSDEGLRIVALAESRDISEPLDSEDIHSLTFVGFLAMRDALRTEVAEAMNRAISAGIKVVMITGDHTVTARAIAKEARIYQEGDIVISGKEIDDMTDAILAEKLSKVSVFARVTPAHKLRIIEAYKARGEVIAMTGDGVNDAASLVAADLGIAMGITGTEVAKEAADIILLDDNFGSIISAIEEGRSIYKTIKKVILYLFSTSLGEALVISGSLVLGYAIPLLPVQIIWLNFVTDGFLDVALAMEPKEDGLLRKSFERPKKYLVDSLMVKRMIIMSLPMMIGTLILFGIYFENDMTKAWTMSLTVLAVFQWFNAWNCRSEDKSIFQMNPFSNKFLIMATATIVSLQFLVLYNPTMQRIFHTTNLGLSEWMIIIPIASSIVVVEEIRKFFYRRSLHIA